MSQQQIIFVATGPDKPGVMDELSQFIHERGANVADSRSTNLGGQFALLTLISGPAEAISRIRADLDSLTARVGFVARLEAPNGSSRSGDSFPYKFVARGSDQATAIRKLSHLFRVLGINIERLETRAQPKASDTAGGFEMRLGLAVPRETPVVMLREYLTQLCSETDITFELTAV